MNKRYQYLSNQANRIRLRALEMTTAAGSGHPTTAMSAAEILSVLYFDQMAYDPAHPDSYEGDDFVLSKGHGAPGLYAAMELAGILAPGEADSLRSSDSPVEGHPVPRVPGVRLATGSLGQGLSAGMGLARAMQMDSISRFVYVLLGDGELAEGNVWEAVNLAPMMGLDNLVALVDVNRLGQSGATVYGWDLEAYQARLAGFGWQVLSVDGHSPEQLVAAIEQGRSGHGPAMILAQTVKGKGFADIEDSSDWHGKVVDGQQLAAARTEIENRITSGGFTPENTLELPPRPERKDRRLTLATEYNKGESVATRTAWGRALVDIGGQEDNVVVIDGDVKGSSRTASFAAEYPGRFIEGYIAEQNMAAMATGLQARGKRPYLATFAAFLTRAHDQFRMAAYSQACINIAGSHTGVSIGEDGPSQMGLEDLAMMRSIYGSTVVSPCDAVSTAKLAGVLNGYEGVSYMRTIRAETPVIYDNEDNFHLGGAKILTSHPADRVLIIATGITVHEAVAAEKKLAAEGIPVGVMDAYSIKPINAEALRMATRTVPAFLTVEDHYPEGGLGEAVAAAVPGMVPVYSLAVTHRPHSGASRDLLAEQGLDAEGIAAKCREIAAAFPRQGR